MKIDTSKIEGYAEMSAEDKLKALEGYDLPDADYSGYVKKDIFDKTAKELADKKKELVSKLSDSEKAQKEAEEHNKEIMDELKALRRESAVSKSKAKFLALGYDEALAQETAEAMADGDNDKVFANAEKAKKAMEKNLRAELLKDTPRPNGGQGNREVSRDDFIKMGYSDQMEYIKNHPNWKSDLKI